MEETKPVLAKTNGRWLSFWLAILLAGIAIIQGLFSFEATSLATANWLQIDLPSSQLWAATLIAAAVVALLLIAVFAWKGRVTLFVFPLWMISFLLFNSPIQLALLAALIWWYIRPYEKSMSNE